MMKKNIRVHSLTNGDFMRFSAAFLFGRTNIQGQNPLHSPNTVCAAQL
jgi:hypothetical protein